MTDATHRYTAVAIALHWLIALALGGLIFSGLTMTQMEEGAEALYQMHKSFGIVVLIAVIARILWRVFNRPPPLPGAIAGYEKAASHAVHYGFYAVMLLLPLSGWLYVSSITGSETHPDVSTVLFGAIGWPDFPLPESLRAPDGNVLFRAPHGFLPLLLIGLLVLHIAGVIKHEAGGAGEGVFSRMAPGLLESTKGPVAPARGGVVAFGAALAVFAVFAGAPLVANALSPGVENAEGVEGENWVIDYDNSEIRFSVIYDGKSVSGVFTDWTASIRFDNDDLDSASATVVVDTGSAQTGTKLYDDSLKAAEWFNVAEFPTANVSLSNFRLAPKGYWADLSLTIKGIEIQRKLRFYLEGKNGQAWASGNTTIRRQDVDLGQTSDPKGEWVADAVRVDIAVIADPAE